jgi:hypothetical protein
MSPTSSFGALWAAKWPPLGYMFQLTMFEWSRSAKRRMPLKSPPNPARPIGSVVGPVGRSWTCAFS